MSRTQAEKLMSSCVGGVCRVCKESMQHPRRPQPLEEDSEGPVLEFFLVPYVGACIQVPPPPPNQIVYVKAERVGGSA